MRLGIFLPNWLGDLVMATPALRAIRQRFGDDARIVGILRPKLAELLAGTNWLDEQWCFDPRGTDPQMRRWALVQRMRRERFDVVLLLTNSLDTALLAWLGGAKQRIGYARNGRGPLLTGKLYPHRVGRHIAAGADGRKLPGPGRGPRLPAAIAASGTGHDRRRRGVGRPDLAQPGPAHRRPRDRLELQWRLRRGEAMARGTLRHAGPKDQCRIGPRRPWCCAGRARPTGRGKS